MNCIYSSLPDNGVELITILKKAEQILIEEELLKDGSGESYLKLYKNIEKATDGKLQDLRVAEYIQKMMQKDLDVDNYVNCMQEFMQSPKFLDSKLNKLNKFINLARSETNTPEIKTLVNNMLTVFEATDFEHNYYKYLTFLLLDKYNQTDFEIQNIDRSLPKETAPKISASALEQAFKIEMQPEEVLFVNGEKTPRNSLRKKVITYLRKHKSESIISVKYDMKIPYSFYIVVQNEMVGAFEEVRNELAKQKFNSSFDDLTQEQQEEIKKTYPMKIVDQE
ncbi:hypothetical protein [Kordia antarctica]|nr:hypothetical protein [Kordia antarctica]